MFVTNAKREKLQDFIIKVYGYNMHLRPNILFFIKIILKIFYYYLNFTIDWSLQHVKKPIYNDLADLSTRKIFLQKNPICEIFLLDQKEFENVIY